MADTEAAQADDGFQWAIVEVMGHRRHVGRMREAEMFGAKMLRIDVPTMVADSGKEGEAATFSAASWLTHFYAPSALFSITLTDEERALRAKWPYVPVGRLIGGLGRDDDTARSPIYDEDDGLPF